MNNENETRSHMVPHGVLTGGAQRAEETLVQQKDDFREQREPSGEGGRVTPSLSIRRRLEFRKIGSVFVSFFANIIFIFWPELFMFLASPPHYALLFPRRPISQFKMLTFPSCLCVSCLRILPKM